MSLLDAMRANKAAHEAKCVATPSAKSAAAPKAQKAKNADAPTAQGTKRASDGPAPTAKRPTAPKAQGTKRASDGPALGPKKSVKTEFDVGTKTCRQDDVGTKRPCAAAGGDVQTSADGDAGPDGDEGRRAQQQSDREAGLFSDKADRKRKWQQYIVISMFVVDSLETLSQLCLKQWRVL